MVRWWSRGRAEGRTETWPPGGSRRPRAAAWPDFTGRLADVSAERMRAWSAAEVVPGRLLPWLPVAFGVGIALYFTAEHEPAWWAPTGLTAVLAVVAVLTRARPAAFPVTLAAAAVAAGFAVATLKTIQVAHPIL